MRVGIVSDLHCNLHGLDTALSVMGAIDELLCLGDSIYQYRFSNDVVARLREREAHVILGNHEETFFAPHGSRARAHDWIDRDLMAWLEAKPHRTDLAFGAKRLQLIHSTPWEPRGDYIFPDNPKLAGFGDTDADFVLYGHTHHKLARRIGRALVINPGSTGEGRDLRNGRQLSCAVLDTVSEEVTFHDFPDLPVGAA